MEKKTNIAKLEILNFCENRLNGIFACRIHICYENSAKSYGFHENAKIIENHLFLLIV